MKTFLRLLEFARPHRKFWPRYLIVSILSVIFGIVYYALLEPLLTVLFLPENIDLTATLPQFTLSVDYFKSAFRFYLGNFMQNYGLLTGLVYVCLVLIVTSFISNLLRYLSQRILVSMRTHIMRNVRRELFKKITKLHIGYFNTHRKGDILSSISNDVTEVQNGVANSFHILFREPLLIIGFLAVLFYMSPKLTAVTLLTLPISVFFIGRLSRKLRREASQAQSMMGRIVSYFEEALTGARIIKAFNAQKYVNKSFQVSNETHRLITKKMFNRQELASPLSEFLGVSVTAAVLFYGGYLQMRGELGMDMPSFVVYISFYYKVLEPAKVISNAYANLQRGLASGERLFAILDIEPAIKKSANPVTISEFKDKIEFRDVSFKYLNEPVLKGINLTITKGKTIALVGPSGAGKSTLADLIPRFYDVTSGQILLDNNDIRDYEPKELISLMGIVTQEAILFNDSVYNNITFGLEGVTKEDVERAAKIANAHEFIVNLESGYDTNIGDRGANLSGGQRQRLAIARAVLKNPPILILDEATSALDTESEKLVQEALTNLMKNRTSIVIAHRLSTIQHADEIVVIKDGSIVERGSHKDLIDNGGLYSHLCQLQTFS
ncbi:MAG: antibiotic ABC transporter ATP-binding protein [Bacteroidetes bacterium GWF2_41_61]|nr:MAG: antibiotic ABC transporter ATP-binding protein [Bacteroidetes bacterium GWE2_40_15]OFY27620.1 MAG: antibiotic ABC transporter ATP-binding protein [Bacteroidetes bacterium GWF2_41_61]OFY91055.1 MAG: antibiotic ABC transporter ATP-binding protein [Bacteroidetes bacterium RIFOXYA12_FULL_40_10]HBG25109.1 antibiotic ABC transporter ATP-binding protein [Rikenellaceae bacterium]HBZ24802.1 antibiotic ABC transporter ATP-binding protein [Rikenellaceae bacterium]